MKSIALIISFIAILGAATPATAGGDPKRGAKVYESCVACHALEPGVHLSGPSLGGIFGRPAGKGEGYLRYSRGLKEAQFFWNANTLDAWVTDPKRIISDTTMSFQGIADASARADLIAFLTIAGAPGGAAVAVEQRLVAASLLRGNAPQPLQGAPATNQVAALRHCGDSYFISTRDGRETPYWEKNVRLKVDSVDTGPTPGVPVVLSAGMGGDRVSVIFASLAELKSLITEQCTQTKLQSSPSTN